jgi:hypothetical protein
MEAFSSIAFELTYDNVEPTIFKVSPYNPQNTLGNITFSGSAPFLHVHFLHVHLDVLL